MEKIQFLLSVLILVSVLNKGLFEQLECYSCDGGPRTQCAQVVSKDVKEPCVGENAQCYEAYVDYQRGALPLVQRRCWTTPENSTAINFCKSFKNPVGKLRSCRTCNTSLCNTRMNFWYNN